MITKSEKNWPGHLMVLRLTNNLFNYQRTDLKEFKTAGNLKKPVLLFRGIIDHCNLMNDTFNWQKLSSIYREE